MSQKCDFRQHIGPYFDGELPRELALRIERHLEQCLPCRKELQGLAQLEELCHTLAPPPATPEEWQKCWQNIQQEVGLRRPKMAPPQGPGLLSWPLLAIAASLAAFLFLPQALLIPPPSPEMSRPSQEHWVTVLDESSPSKENTSATTRPTAYLNESYTEYIEPGENYTCSVEVPGEAAEISVITVQQEEP